MDGIQALKREKDLSALTVRSGINEAVRLVPEDCIRGVIMPSPHECVIITDSSAAHGSRSGDVTAGLSSVTVSGDRMLCGEENAARILSALHSAGVSARYVSVSETGVTAYVGADESDKAWAALLELI